MESMLKSIQDFCYLLYIIDWLSLHISRATLFATLDSYIQEMSEATEYQSLQDYIKEHGFNGILFACYDEFLHNEYLDEEFMYDMLKCTSKWEEYLADVQKWRETIKNEE